MTIGERIRLKREELGLTQDELAKKLGYKSRSSVNKIENSRELPLKKVKMMANILDCSPSYLMGWDDDKEQSDIQHKYYLNDETAQAAQEIFENEELRLLFDAARDAEPEDLRTVHDLLLRMKRSEKHIDDTGC